MSLPSGTSFPPVPVLAELGANRHRACEGCDCTDEDACLDEQTGKPCYWVEGIGADLCSVCARLAGALDLPAEAPAFEGDLDDKPLVQLYSDADANRAIAAARAGRA